MEPEQLKELVEGKFVDALRTAAAEMTMEELHEKRGAYVKRVRETVAEDLTKNGLELESVSLTQLDQTGMEYFNPSNAFDAEGLTRLTETIEQRKKQRNDVEQDTLIAIRNKNLEAEKLSLEIDREGEYARLSQQREVEIARARQRAELMTERAQREEQGESAQIAAKQTIDAARIRSEQTIEQERIGKERTIQSAEIERRMAVELAEQKRAIAVAKESEAQSNAQAAADAARADAVTAEEKVFTAREVEMAERKKAIELIGSRQVAEREALRLTSAARAEKDASADRGAAVRAQAEADADADKIRSMAMRVRAEIEAEALQDDERRPQHAVAGSAHVGAAHAPGREGRGHHPRVGAADGADRGHQDPARRRARRRWRRPRRQRRCQPWRQLLRRPRQLGAALPRPGAARRPAAARDRHRRRRHPAPGRRRQRRAGRAAARRRRARRNSR